MIRRLLGSTSSRRVVYEASRNARKRFFGSSVALVGGYGTYEVVNRVFRKEKKKTKEKEDSSSPIFQARYKAHLKLKKTFKELTYGIAMTGVGATIGYKFHNRFRGFRNKWIGGALYGLSSISLLLGTMLTDENEFPVLKRCFYYGFAGISGFGLCSFHPDILLRASLYTFGVSGGLTAGAYFSREWKSVESYLSIPLFIGLNVYFVSSLFLLFFGHRNSAAVETGRMLYMRSGLVLFSLYLYYDMHVLFTKYNDREISLIHSGTKEDIGVSHINDAMGVYLDILNILIRIAMILSDNE